MRKRKKWFFSRLGYRQTGQALVIVLVFVLLGSLTLVPTLSYMSTALKSGVSYEDNSKEFFTADAGIENGLWRIKYDFLGPDYDVYDFNTVWEYETDPVNNRTAEVTIQNIWVPSNVTLGGLGLTPAQARATIESEKLVITGTAGGTPGQPYRIKIEFTPAVGDNLTIKSIGIWLPQGFEYVSGNSSLEKINPLEEWYPASVTETTVPGGSTVVWDYIDYPHILDFPDINPEETTVTANFTFSYTPPAANPTRLPVAIAWVTTEMLDSSGLLKTNDVPISWDTDTRLYKITSSTGQTQIEAYSSKSQLRKLGDAIAGDYVAIGNSLMTGGTDPNYVKNTLLSESTAYVSTVAPDYPEDADVIAAYLYWSGFLYDISQWSDSCSNFNNWTRDLEEDGQIRVPTGDGDSNGTWNPTPASPATYWDKVDETTADDDDYITGTPDSGGYKLFTFSPFTVADQSIASLTVSFRARDYTDGNNNIRAYIKVNGSYYSGSSVNPGTGFSTYSYSFTTNPNTGTAWTLADINGTGSNPLQQFGVYSDDLRPDIEVSMVYAKADYASNSLWTIYSGQFQGQGSSNSSIPIRTLTLKNSIDLSSYPAGTVSVGWEQTRSGTLEYPDALYYAVSGDGGASWSSDMEAFNYSASPASPYYYVIPNEYKTDSFKIRFYFNFNVSDEKVFLDDINIYYMPPDTSATFKINGEQVYLDVNGEPQAGAQPITASFSAVLVAPNVGTTQPGYFYACYLDVSKLVKKYPVVPGELHHTGNTDYTVGSVSGNLNQYVSFAGWSLIIIYGSPASAGHYLYLRDIHDIYAACPQNSDLDFDYDGQPGGEITGFVFPEPIRDKEGTVTDNVSAHITCFVCEGDTYVGDYLQITGQQSGISKYLSNSASPLDNVWNSESPGVSYNGVDVDTFEVLWSDNVFTPGDTKVTLLMLTGQDVWNLVYIIMSVRSETVTGGTENYVIGRR